jgi:rod shape-determining protein MreC
MYFFYRWWDRYRAALGLLLFGGSGAWFLLQTNGAALQELYRLATLPFQPDITKQEQLVQARTWELQQNLAELKAQNQSLRALLKQPAIAENKSIPAPIIGRSADHWWQQLLINRGSADGIRLGAAVMAPGGLIGRVTLVTPNTSRVLLLTDPTSRVGVTVARTRQMGILRGQSDVQAVIEFFEKDPKVRPGDVVITSALSSLFPAGLPIGQIQSVNLKDTAHPRAVVDLAAPMGNLEWVMVTRNVKSPQTMVAPRP